MGQEPGTNEEIATFCKKNFKNVVGYDPVDLEEINNLNLTLPKSLEETSAFAQKENPILKISEFSLKKAEDDPIEVLRSAASGRHRQPAARDHRALAAVEAVKRSAAAIQHRF